MPKKYLLYIHDDRFQKESHKSRMVNKLLAKHYGDTPKKTIDKKIPSKNTEEAVKFCKHNAVKGMCKKGCK